MIGLGIVWVVKYQSLKWCLYEIKHHFIGKVRICLNAILEYNALLP